MTDETKTDTAKPTNVFVVCKMPSGALLELGNKGEPDYEMVLLKGANEGKFNPADGRFTEKTEGGFGLTIVSAAFWRKWSKANAAIVAEWKARKTVAAYDTRDEADMHRIEHAGVRTGFEPFDPAKMPKGLEQADKPNANAA